MFIKLNLTKVVNPLLLMFSPFELCPVLVQSVANLPPSGDSLKILAGDLGSRVYTKYSVLQKQQNQMVEKLGKIYCSYTDLLAKDTKVDTFYVSSRCSRCIFELMLLFNLQKRLMSSRL